jgi:hypothetical protein
VGSFVTGVTEYNLKYRRSCLLVRIGKWELYTVLRIAIGAVGYSSPRKKDHSFEIGFPVKSCLEAAATKVCW